ncbi:hypothetical protein A6P54_00195 [Bacillus sp. MKU004]|nr:hypothetical protein A6P54_00195 [Bacillus sp. MKU004]
MVFAAVNAAAEVEFNEKTLGKEIKVSLIDQGFIRAVPPEWPALFRTLFSEKYFYYFTKNMLNYPKEFIS